MLHHACIPCYLLNDPLMTSHFIRKTKQKKVLFFLQKFSSTSNANNQHGDYLFIWIARKRCSQFLVFNSLALFLSFGSRGPLSSFKFPHIPLRLSPLFLSSTFSFFLDLQLFFLLFFFLFSLDDSEALLFAYRKNTHEIVTMMLARFTQEYYFLYRSYILIEPCQYLRNFSFYRFVFASPKVLILCWFWINLCSVGIKFTSEVLYIYIYIIFFLHILITKQLVFVQTAKQSFNIMYTMHDKYIRISTFQYLLS